MQPVRSWSEIEDLPSSEYAMIPRLDVPLSAGNGSFVWQVDQKKPQAFRSEWLDRAVLKAKDLACMYASGDSMEPRICDTDSLLVDLSDTEIQDGKVYAIRYGEEVRVKRLYKKLDSSILIRSDNSDIHPEITISDEELEHFEVIGRIVWVGGAI